MTSRHGRLRVYLGMAPGVGKTYAMLEEARRRRSRGTDVVVGFVETYGRPATDALLEGLEVVPRTRIVHRGVTVEEMDAEAVILRAPTIALIDELAHTNAPGSPHQKRWEDIEAIRDAGIDVLSTCNVQHLDSIADAVETMIGVPVHERVPDEVLRGADEIELVDLSPVRLRRRMLRGEVYPPNRAAVALERFFTEGNLTALRDLALRFVSGRVGAQLGRGMPRGVTSGDERVLVVIDDSDASVRTLRRATVLAGRLRAPLIAIVFVPASARDLEDGRDRIEGVAADAADGGAEVMRVSTDDRAGAIAEIVRSRRATHLVLGQSHRGRLARLVEDPLPDRVLRLVPDLEISLVGPGRSVAEVRRETF